MLKFRYKRTLFYIKPFTDTLPVSVLDSFFSTARGLASNMSCPWNGVPLPHTQTVQQKMVNTITIPLHPVLVRMSVANTHLYLRRGLVCVSSVTPNKAEGIQIHREYRFRIIRYRIKLIVWGGLLMYVCMDILSAALPFLALELRKWGRRHPHILLNRDGAME